MKEPQTPNREAVKIARVEAKEGTVSLFINGKLERDWSGPAGRDHTPFDELEVAIDDINAAVTRLLAEERGKAEKWERIAAERLGMIRDRDHKLAVAGTEAAVKALERAAEDFRIRMRPLEDSERLRALAARYKSGEEKV